MVSHRPTRPGGPAPDALALRPMARVERIALFEREVRERLSRSALELLFAGAETISEGQRSARGGKEIFFGSTMLTIELARLAPALRDRCDARTATRLAARLAEDAAAQARIRSIAAREAARLAGAAPKSVEAELRVRAQGATVFVDVDVEALL